MGMRVCGCVAHPKGAIVASMRKAAGEDGEFGNLLERIIQRRRGEPQKAYTQTPHRAGSEQENYPVP